MWVADSKACPCASGRPYSECCQQYHTGSVWEPTAESLMRARFAAYVKGEVRRDNVVQLCNCRTLPLPPLFHGNHGRNQLRSQSERPSGAACPLVIAMTLLQFLRR